MSKKRITRNASIKNSTLFIKIKPNIKQQIFLCLYNKENNNRYIPKTPQRVEYEYGIAKEKFELENTLTTIKKIVNTKAIILFLNFFKIP